MFTGLVQHVSKMKVLLDANSPAILTGIGVAGTVVTAYLSGRATFRAADLINREQDILVADWREGESDSPPSDLSKTDKVKLVWSQYIPPVAAGTLTITSIILANRVSSARIAALAVAAVTSERALQEYKDKVVEKLGERKTQDIRDEIAQDRVNARPPGSNEVILVGQGQVLCYDITTDRYFQSTVEDIKRAENKINSELLNHMAASLAEFHDEIGLRPTSYTDSVGWGSPEMFKVAFSSVLSPDGRPCLAIDFERPPQLEYNQVY